ncbi:WYL domain-containing protein [Desulfonatronum thiodismutans]|uniref:WYL domain-containing protein n=1 Tax=Desulfonatronum thiodismutans TaxID=159290 RepID=UPI0004ABE1FE|nr:WYL domain-containing protein [Desulfonatronum thiodismutans]
MSKLTVKDTKSFHRLAFFESRLFWAGRCGNIDIVKHFGISRPHASLTIREYEELAPGNIFYDPRGKTYRPGDKFKPAIISTDPDRALGHVLLGDSHLGDMPEMLRMPSPQRALSADVLRAFLSAVADKRGLGILYQSLSSPEPAWRDVTPHAFGHDGQRWHARAFCHRSQVFKDFVLGRVFETARGVLSQGNPTADKDWHEDVDLVLGPDPRLESGARAAIERDFCMNEGRAVFRLRRAMLWYVLEHWNLAGTPFPEPRRQQIILLNPEVLSEMGKGRGS